MHTSPPPTLVLFLPARAYQKTKSELCPIPHPRREEAKAEGVAAVQRAEVGKVLIHWRQ